MFGTLSDPVPTENASRASVPRHLVKKYGEGMNLIYSYRSSHLSVFLKIAFQEILQTFETWKIA